MQRCCRRCQVLGGVRSATWYHRARDGGACRVRQALLWLVRGKSTRVSLVALAAGAGVASARLEFLSPTWIQGSIGAQGSFGSNEGLRMEQTDYHAVRRAPLEEI